MLTKRHCTLALVLGTAVALPGCQSPSLGGLAFWNKGDSSALSSTPDVRSQKYEGLAKEFGGTPSKPVGHPRPGTTPLGGPPAESEGNFLTASWKKTTGAVGGVFASKPADPNAGDPLRLDNQPKKVGPEVYVAAGRLHESQGKFDEAEEHYNKALAIAPNDEGALVGLARLHDRQGNSAKAIELYHKAIKANPASALAYNDMGLCYARQRQLDMSIQALRKAATLQSDSAKYRNNLATVLVEAGRIDEALRELNTLGSPAVAHYNVGYLLHQKGQTAVAIRHFQQALVLDPTLAPAQQMLVQLSSQSAAPLATTPQPAVQPAPTPANTYGSPFQSASYPGATASIGDDTPPLAAQPSPGGASFRIADDQPSTAVGGNAYDYGAPRHLPPVE